MSPRPIRPAPFFAIPDWLPAVGIVGAGLMGRQIATAVVERGLSVTLFDSSPATVQRAVSEVSGETGDPAWEIFPAESVRDLRHCDLLVETVVEDESVKRAVLSELEGVASAGAVLVTNTSSLPIGRLAEVLRRPERFCGLHFCHPLSERRLAEVVPGERAGEATFAAVVDFAKRLGRAPLAVPDRSGFLLNRLLMPYLNAALEMAADGSAST